MQTEILPQLYTWGCPSMLRLMWCLKWWELYSASPQLPSKYCSCFTFYAELLWQFSIAQRDRKHNSNILQTRPRSTAVPEIYLFPDLPGPTGIIPGGGGPIIGIIGGPPIWGAGIMPGRGGPAEHIYRLVTHLAAFTFINNMQCKIVIKLHRKF